MLLLSIDTSSSTCLVTLGNSDQLLYSRGSENERSHSQVLLPFIQEILLEASISLGDLAGLSVAMGPGSFVGVRLAVSVVQGLALGANLKVWPISSLQVLAQSYFLAHLNCSRIRVLRDAHMGDVYVGEYEQDVGMMRSVVSSEIPLGDFIEKAHLSENNQIINPGVMDIVPTPEALHQIAWENFVSQKEQGKSPEQVAPTYLRGASLWKKLG
jgi:tRNA threonylcarbamoyladenosine biosynthesis protein TsaB